MRLLNFLIFNYLQNSLTSTLRLMENRVARSRKIQYTTRPNGIADGETASEPPARAKVHTEESRRVPSNEVGGPRGRADIICRRGRTS